MKVLFVDDEKIIREGISQIIHWKQLGCERLVTADSADSALEAMEQDDFDLVITDICMQKMSGIELAKKIREKKPDTKIIILSAHEDFSYAREAIEVGVMKYMLKPVTPDELENAVREAMKQVDSDIQRASKITESEKFVNVYRPQLVRDFWRMLLLKEMPNDFDERMTLAGIPFDKTGFCCVVVQSENTEIPDDNRLADAAMAADKVFGGCLECIKMDIGEIVIILDKHPDPAQIIYFQNELEAIWKISVQAACGRYTEDYKNLSASLDDARIVLSDKNRQKHTIEDLVADSVRLIERNIGNEDFGVNDIADALHISPSYLSKIFKKILGATCIEYITHKKMEKAKDLLANTSMTQEEIAHAVGYANVHYFGMLFKKQFDETPGQYRKQVKG